MIDPVARIHPEVEQVTFDIIFPKELESYKVKSPEFKTHLDVTPKLRVRVIGEGIFDAFTGKFGTEGADSIRWTVNLDSCELEVIE